MESAEILPDGNISLSSTITGKEASRMLQNAKHELAELLKRKLELETRIATLESAGVKLPNVTEAVPV